MGLVHGQEISAEKIERIVSRQFTPQKFASLCNAIAWASAGQRCSSLPSFTERVNVADSGIDAEWQTELPDDCRSCSALLGSGWNVFQYKQRDIFSQGRDKTFSNLKAGLKGAVKDLYERTQKRPDRYVLFTNLDLTHPTTDKKRRSRKNVPQGQKGQLKQKILEGYDQPDKVQVEIVGAAELSSLLNSLPHIRSAFFCPSEFSTWEEAWRTHRSQKPLGANVELIGRKQELDDLRSYIDNSEIRAIILSGSPYMGKTRLALEVTKHRPIETVVALDPSSINVTDVLALESKGREIIVILKAPDTNKTKELVEQVIAKPNLKLLITLPTAENASIVNSDRDDRVQDYRLSSLSNWQSSKLLSVAKAAFDYSLESWVIKQAGGNPRILLLAASFGSELRKQSNNFLNVAKDIENEVRRTLDDEAIKILQLLSILTRVGIKGEPRQEIELICQCLGYKVPPKTDVKKFLTRLEQAGVVRVIGLYAEVIPPLLANYLAASALEDCFAELLTLFAALSQDGQFRLLSRLQSLKIKEVDRFWNELFRPEGLLSNFQSALSHASLLRLASRSYPSRVVNLIKNGLHEIVAQRISITYSTKIHLFETIKELLFRKNTSIESLRCLIMLAESETATSAQSATSLFCECFRALHTQFPLSMKKRLSLLNEILSSEQSLQVRLLGVNAIISSLTNQRTWTPPRESDGGEPLDPPPNLTGADVRNYNDALIDLLFTVAQSEEAILAEEARNALPEASAECAILKALPETDIAKFQTLVEWVLNHQVTLPVSDLAEALQRVNRVFTERRNKRDEQGAAELQPYIKEIEILIARLEQGDFSTKLRRWTGKWTVHHNESRINEDGNLVYRNEEELKNLAQQAIENPQFLTDELIEWLCSGRAREVNEFFFWLGRMDVEKIWIYTIDKIGNAQKGMVAFASYYGGLSQSDPQFISKRLDELTASNQVTAEAIVNVTRYLGGDLVGVKRMEKLIRENRVNPIFVVQVLKCGRWIDSLSPDEYLRLLKVIAGSDLEHAAAVIDFIRMWLHSQRPIDGQLAELAWQCLEAAHTIIDRTGTENDDCDKLAAELAESDIERGFKLLEKLLLQPYGCWNPINRYSQRKFWQLLYNNNPERALRVSLSVALNNLSKHYSIIYHLYGLIDQQENTDVLIKLALESENQAQFVCKIITFEKQNFWSIVLKVIEKFPNSEGIKEALSDKSKQMLNAETAPAAARPWLEELEQSLQNWAEERRVAEINREQNDRSQAETNLITAERVWAVKKLLGLGKLDKMQKLFSQDDLLTILKLID